MATAPWCLRVSSVGNECRYRVYRAHRVIRGLFRTTTCMPCLDTRPSLMNVNIHICLCGRCAIVCSLTYPVEVLTRGHRVKIWSVTCLDPRPRPRRRSTVWFWRPVPTVRPLTRLSLMAPSKEASICSVMVHHDSARRERLECPVLGGTALDTAHGHIAHDQRSC
jgi:hypothetical protein